MLLLGTLLEPLLAALALLVSRMLKGPQARDAKFVVRGSGFEVPKASNLEFTPVLLVSPFPPASRISCAL